MAIHTDRIDYCVLTMLLLGRHDGQRVWKSFDWDAMDLLHKTGLISDRTRRIRGFDKRRAGEDRATVSGFVWDKPVSGALKNVHPICSSGST